MTLDWRDEHTQDWVVRDKLLATFADTCNYQVSVSALADTYFIGVMLRRWAADNPDTLTAWRSLPNWRRIVGWQRRLRDPAPSHKFEATLQAFFAAGQYGIGSERGWSIMSRQTFVNRSDGADRTYGFWIAEYSIGCVCPVTWQEWITLLPPPPPPRIFTQQEWLSEWIVAEEERCEKWYQEEMDLWSIDGRATEPLMPTPRPAPPVPSNTDPAQSLIRPRAPFMEPMTEAERLALAIDEFQCPGEPVESPSGVTAEMFRKIMAVGGVQPLAADRNR